MTERRRKAIPVEVGRSVAEWIGRSPDEPVPARVRVRVFDRAKGKCQECTREIGTGDRWICDHIVALINGGENRERNLRCICDWCDKSIKTPADVAVKSKVARTRKAHLGLKPRSSLSHPHLKRTMSGKIVDRRTGEPVERKAR